MCLDNDAGNFGNGLYELRLKRGLSQKQVAERAQLPRGYLSQLENSKRPPPPLATVARIAAALAATGQERQRLELMAGTERRNIGRRAWELPDEIERLIKALMYAATDVTAEKLRRIEAILTEE